MSARARITILLASTFLLLCASARFARAESLPRMIPRLIEQGGWLKSNYPGQAPSPSAAEKPVTHGAAPIPAQLFGSTLRFALLARDWREAYSITDGHPLVFDRMRLIRSSRMGVLRLSAVDGRIVPFVELSAGQWRVDAELLPGLPRDTELAAQVAVGFEMRIAPRGAFAFDVEDTSIYREPGGSNMPVSKVYASFVALRAEF